MKTNSQCNRILNALNRARKPIPAPQLARIASGKSNGFCLSFSREISRLRADGWNVVKVKDCWVNGQRHTAYALA